MEDKNKSVMREMEETRSSLTDKLEVLESRVTDKVEPVANAVQRVSEAAANIVEDVKDTVHEVTGKIHESVQEVSDRVQAVSDRFHEVSERVEESVKSLSSTFNLRNQVEQHPWVAVGLAATAGCMLGNFTGPSPARTQEASTTSHSRHSKGSGNGWARKREGTQQEGLFTEELRRLKTLAIGAVLGIVRDMAKTGLPGTLGAKIAEEIDTLTTRLGAEPLREPVLAASEPRNGGSTGAPRAENGANRMRAENL